MEGFWVSRDKYEYTARVYRCFRETCKGSRENSTCWNLAAWLGNDENENGDVSADEDEDQDDDEDDDDTNVQDCDADRLLCETGAAGPLCKHSKTSSVVFRSIRSFRSFHLFLLGFHDSARCALRIFITYPFLPSL